MTLTELQTAQQLQYLGDCKRQILREVMQRNCLNCDWLDSKQFCSQFQQPAPDFFLTTGCERWKDTIPF